MEEEARPQQQALVILAIPEEEDASRRARAFARHQVATRPLFMALGALVLGMVAMRLLRRGARAL
jgi:hypothetical protein